MDGAFRFSNKEIINCLARLDCFGASFANYGFCGILSESSDKVFVAEKIVVCQDHATAKALKYVLHFCCNL